MRRLRAGPAREDQGRAHPRWQGGQSGLLPSVHPAIVLLYKYVTQALLDGSPNAAAMFDDMVVLTEQWIGKYAPKITEDYRAYAAVLVGMQSGILALHDHVSRALGVDIFTTEGHLRMAGALADF